MTSLLKYWKLILAGGIAVVVLLSFFYVRNLQSNLKEMKAENETLKVSQMQLTNYVTKTEQARKEAEKLAQELSGMVKEIPVDPACNRPDSFARVLDRLR